jgi:hypothetical protein
MEDNVFQFGNQNPPWRKSFSSLEIKIPHGGNRFPVWKSKSPLEETIFQFGNRNPPQWKRSSDLEEENHCGGNVPPIWRRKIIVVCGGISSLARAKKPYQA